MRSSVHASSQKMLGGAESMIRHLTWKPTYDMVSMLSGFLPCAVYASVEMVFDISIGSINKTIWVSRRESGDARACFTNTRPTAAGV